MKKYVLILTTIIIVGLICMSGVSANAAIVKKYGTAVERVTDTDENGQNQSTQNDDSEADNIPSSYSSKDLGYTTSVKSQIGDLCWVYSAVSSYETLLLKNNLFYGDLSVDSIDLWGSIRDNGEGWQRTEKLGGYTSIAIGCFTSWNAPVTSGEEKPRFGTTAVRYFTKNDTTEIKKAIMRHGSVTANLNYNKLGRSVDRNSFFINDSVGKISGHSVSIVGWDDNYNKENFTGNYDPENDGAWLCKNSWGDHDTDYGGYLWISYEDYYLMNSEYFDDAFSIEGYQEIKDTDHLYQNEEYGATYEFEYINDSHQTFFNVYDFSEYGNVLDKVVFETTSSGADYSIYYVPLDSENKPVQNRLRWTKLSSGIVDYRGYICSDFEDFTAPKAKAAIAVDIDTSKIDRYCGIGVSEWLRSESTKEMIFIDTCKSGNSFIEYDGKITDLRDFYIDNLDDEIGGTFVIKAITNKTTVTNIKGDVNLDETVNINDATAIQMFVTGMNPSLYSDQFTNADMNGDGIVNINDATEIQLNLAGLK